MEKYTIGIDYGTLSSRAVLIEVATGRERADSIFQYPHGVMETALPDGTPLGTDWALQHPQDYIDAFEHNIPEVIKKASVNPKDIISIGVDFTSCTFLPIKADGTPLSMVKGFESTPHAWIKLWKHHGAQDQANRLNDLAHQRGEAFIKRYGGKVSSEWQVPKVMEIVEESPEVYAAADHFIEAGDWLVWALTGNITKSSCAAGYKGLWHKAAGYPTNDFFAALHPSMEHYVEEKLEYPVVSMGSIAGRITKAVSEKTGLVEGTPVIAAIIDAHAGFPSAQIQGANAMLAIIGTSTCHIVMSETEEEVPGSAGVVEDGVYPGFFAYESGQSAVGDIFAWFVDNCVPASYYAQAKAEDKNIHLFLQEKAEQLTVGESGLLALDWWNGNRSVLMDADLSGLLLGMTLQTKPEEIYRGLIEATAYGTRKIIESYNENGVEIKEFFASGGISQKNAMAMQIYSDVIGLPIKIDASEQGGALGSGIFAASAVSKEDGGHGDIMTAAKIMGGIKEKIYQPILENQKIYNQLYQEYTVLHDYFGRGQNNVMKKLKEIRLVAKK